MTIKYKTTPNKKQAVTTDKELKGHLKYNTIVFPMNKEKFDLFEAGEL